MKEKELDINKLNGYEDQDSIFDMIDKLLDAQKEVICAWHLIQSIDELGVEINKKRIDKFINKYLKDIEHGKI